MWVYAGSFGYASEVGVRVFSPQWRKDAEERKEGGVPFTLRIIFDGALALHGHSLFTKRLNPCFSRGTLKLIRKPRRFFASFR